MNKNKLFVDRSHVLRTYVAIFILVCAFNLFFGFITTPFWCRIICGRIRFDVVLMLFGSRVFFLFHFDVLVDSWW